MTNMTVERAPSVVSEFQKWLMTTDSRVEGDVSLADFPFSRVASDTRCAETLWDRSRAQQCLFLDYTTPPPFSQLVDILLMYEYSMQT